MAPDTDAVPARDANRRIARPLGGAVSVLLTLAAVTVAVALAAAPWSHHASFYGFGPGPVCADVPLNGVATSSVTLAHIRAGGYASSGQQVTACAEQPTLGQRALVTLTQVPAAVLDLAVLVLLWQLIRTIRAAGPFALLVARRLRFLGWFILAGSVAVTAGQSLAQSAFAASIVSDPIPAAANAIGAETDGIVLPLLIACGLLTLARVIRAGAQMSDDLAGTV